MANSAILQSAGVLANNGQMYQGSQNKIFDAISQAAAMYQRIKAQKDANLSAERMKQAEIDAEAAKSAMKPEAILAKAIQFGPENLSPQERAVFDAAQRVKGAEVAIQPQTGQAYNPYQAITLDNIGKPPTAPASPASAMFAAPQSGMLLPPPTAGGVGSPELFQEPAPAPIGQKEVMTDSTGMGATPVGKMKKYEKELEFYSKKLEKNLDLDLEKVATGKGKSLAQQALDRMNQINEDLNGRGALVSDKKSLVGNIGAMARNATVGAPLIGSANVGQAVEKAADPKTKALREEYDRLRSVLLPFYAKASGLGAKSLDSEGERKSMLDSFGSMEGTYEGNKAQLNNLSDMIGTGLKAIDGLKPEASKFTDGQTATNPKTGEKLIFQGGKWSKL